MLRVLALLLVLATPVFAGECTTTTEQKLTEAIAAEPHRLVATLEGDALYRFIANCNLHGWMLGVGANQFDRIYIVDAGKTHGATSDNVWLFFVKDGCLKLAAPASKPEIMRVLAE